MEEMKKSMPIDGNSPWFSGHFPDDPIYPGIAQLKMVVDLLAESMPDTMYMSGLSRIKFRKIVRPDDVLDISVSSDNKEDSYTFKITSGDEDVCSGKMSFSQKR